MNRPAASRVLPYRKPTEGRDYWVIDDLLPDAGAIRARCLAKPDWSLGFPHTAETWPGRRAIPALEPGDLAEVDARVMHATGSRKLWVEAAPDGKTLLPNGLGMGVFCVIRTEHPFIQEDLKVYNLQPGGNEHNLRFTSFYPGPVL